MQSALFDSDLMFLLMDSIKQKKKTKKNPSPKVQPELQINTATSYTVFSHIGSMKGGSCSLQSEAQGFWQREADDTPKTVI